MQMADRGSRAFAALTAITVAAFVALVLLAHVALGQSSQNGRNALDAPTLLKCPHDLSRLSTFDKLRLLPAEVISVEGDLVEWKATGADEVRLGTSALTEATEFAVTKNGKPEKAERDLFVNSAGTRAEWTLLLCSRCKTLLAARKDK
jgi:hypothetical protein